MTTAGHDQKDKDETTQRFQTCFTFAFTVVLAWNCLECIISNQHHSSLNHTQTYKSTTYGKKVTYVNP
jgi:hypothetical protein